MILIKDQLGGKVLTEFAEVRQILNLFLLKGWDIK